MANRNSSFGEGQSGIIKPAVERAALSGGKSDVKVQPTFAKPKVVEQDGTNVFNDGTVVSEIELARSRKSYVKEGGTVGEARVARQITTPSGRNATPKEALQKLNEHYGVLNSFATTHSGSIQTAARAMPAAHKDHGTATVGLSSASENLALAKTAMGQRNNPKTNEHLQKASRALKSAHGLLNSANVREVTGVEVPIHKDEINSWNEHTNNLQVFRRKGKPFSEVNLGGVRLNTASRDVKDLAKNPELKGTLAGDKMKRAIQGTPRTPKYERDLPGMPTKGEKGTGVIDTRTRGTSSGTTGANDPRRKSDGKSRVDINLPKANLPKIGDTSKRVKPETTAQRRYRQGK
jgi:hypothetical protein